LKNTFPTQAVLAAPPILFSKPENEPIFTKFHIIRQDKSVC